MSELTRSDLAEMVRVALAELGDTPDAVAETLRRAGIQGRRQSSCGCPVALWLARRVPALLDRNGLFRWEVTAGAVLDGDGEVWVGLPVPVKRFIEHFDTSDPAYLDLEAVRP